MPRYIALLILLSILAPCALHGQAIKAGEARLKCVADTYIAAFPGGERSLTVKNSEQGANAGTTPRLKLKKNENQPLLRFDFTPVPAGATITEATLYIHILDNKTVNHIGYCSLHADWNEGSGKWDDGEGGETKPNTKHDGACFFGPKGTDSRWREYPDSDFTCVITGNGGNATGVVRAVKEAGGRHAISLDPYVVMAMMHHGQTLVLQEETGIFRKDLDNQFFVSREGDASCAPLLEVRWAGARDSTAPAFAGPVTAEPGPLTGSLRIHLSAAGDDGTEGTALGYDVSIDGTSIPRVLVPRPQRQHRTMIVRDLTPGKTVTIAVTAFDEAGNKAETVIKAATAPALKSTLAARPRPASGSGSLKGRAGFKASLSDGMTLFDPLTGGLVPGQTRSGTDRRLSQVYACRGEIIGLQLLLEPLPGNAAVKGITLSTDGFTGRGRKEDGITADRIEFFREHFIKTGSTWFADVLEPLTGRTLGLPSQPNLNGQKLAAVYVDITIPAATEPGRYTGTFSLTAAGGQKLEVPLAIDVVDITLPDAVSFIIEMNAYSKSDDLDKFHAVHRLCHKHRLGYNVVPYSHTRPHDHLTYPRTDGRGSAMHVTGWEKYDEYYGPLLSGELFKDLPRAGRPVSHLYLPFHDSWPVSLQETCPVPELWKNRPASTNNDAFADWENRVAVMQPLIADNFSAEWLEGNAAVAAAFRQHCLDKGWTRTQLQIFNNHKHYFAASQPSQSLWVMDEPQYGRDFRALNFEYAHVFNHMNDPRLNLVMRADISRPEWQGDRMDDAVSLSVVSGSLNTYQRLVNDRMYTTGETLWWYGGAGGPEDDPAALSVLFLDKWAQGCSGGMPVYTTFHSEQSWDRTDRLRVVPFAKDGLPVPSFRMKAYRYGQQLIELLNLLAVRDGYSPAHVAMLAEQIVSLDRELIRTNPDDPGTIRYKGLDIDKVEELRTRIMATLVKTGR